MISNQNYKNKKITNSKIQIFSSQSFSFANDFNFLHPNIPQNNKRCTSNNKKKKNWTKPYLFILI